MVRNKIHRNIPKYLRPIPKLSPLDLGSSSTSSFSSPEKIDWDALMQEARKANTAKSAAGPSVVKPAASAESVRKWLREHGVGFPEGATLAELQGFGTIGDNGRGLLYPREDHEQQPKRPPGRPPGLRNLGNSCYVNACLRALHATAALRRLLLCGPPARDEAGAAPALTPSKRPLDALPRVTPGAGKE